MHTGRLVKTGNSWAVVVPRKHMAGLGWNPQDEIEQRIDGGQLVMHNVTQHRVKVVRKTKGFDEQPAGR